MSHHFIVCYCNYFVRIKLFGRNYSKVADMVINICHCSGTYKFLLKGEEYDIKKYGKTLGQFPLIDHTGYLSASPLPEAPHVQYKSKEEEVTNVNKQWLKDVMDVIYWVLLT